MSNYLAVDASSRYLTVVAKKDENLIVRHLADCAMKHSVIIMDEVDAAFGQAGLTPAECDFFCAVTGPGSFTGIRIGISTVKGLALGTKKPLLGITSFDLVAYNVNSKNFCVVIDAAHSHFYVKGYGEKAFASAYLSLDEVEKLGCPLYGFEDLPLKNYTKLEIKDCLPVAIERSEGNFSEDITALYVRKSQAEEGRK
ncbi:MAG: tRNA (adenosine(37)-N6)-threonylcarbamoyltransferase complex dimerization subunit type 1 TsaB [Clostridiales bacterium]|nr:tRNA (adenosine(37)-N6)-threonylcarbamoyltransferase complex dimerization subunit type 1 TsaB [Clostridiales bacterium]